jgi:hypothetical protein
MFKVKIEDIQKIKPDFKEDMVKYVLFAEIIGNGEQADMIALTTGEAIQVTRHNLLLLQSPYGHLDLERELIAQHECINAYSDTKYSFVLVPIAVKEERSEDN